MSQTSLQLLTLLLLLMLTPASYTSVGHHAKLKEDAATESERIDALRQLRELVLSGLELRRRVDTGESEATDEKAAEAGDAATLDDVVAGAKAFATGMAVEPPRTTITTAGTTRLFLTTPSDVTGNGTAAVAGVLSAAWFHGLFARMLTVMPLAAWIAVLVVAVLLLLGIIVLIVMCCRRRLRDSVSGRRRKESPQTLKYNDLDIVGKEQPPFGVINFSLEYDVPTSHLIVTVSSCIGLPKELKDIDPYVVIQVSPDVVSGMKHQPPQTTDTVERSKVVKNNVNPAFNYTRTVKIKDKRQLKRKVITFDIYDWDIGTRHRMIARKVLRLANLGERLDDILGRKVELSRNLQPGVNQEATGPGDICLALCYSSLEKHLWVHVIECKGVFLQKFEQPDFETLPNTYVKLSLAMAGSAKRISKSTAMISESRNPYFNEQFVFKMEPIQMQVVSLRLTLMHRTDTLRIKRPVGSLTLSLTAEKDSLALMHWREAVLTHNRPIARWHSLITPEEERRLADRKAAAELKRQMELAEDEGGASTSSLVRPTEE